MIPEKTKLCSHCRRRKALNAFHSETTPYCKACNTDATRQRNYRSEAKRDPGQFARKIRAKETQLAGMVKALSEVRG